MKQAALYATGITGDSRREGAFIQVSDKCYHWAVIGLLCLGAGLRVAAFSPYDYIHMDEIFQYQERAWRMVHGYGTVTWEIAAGARGGLLPSFLATFMMLAKVCGGSDWTGLMLARLAYAAACFIALPAALALGRLSSRSHALCALFVAAIWYESVLFSVSTLSESLSAALFLAGAVALLWGLEHNRRRLLQLAGFLLLLAVEARLQVVVLVALLVISAAWRRSAAWVPLAMGGLAAAALAAAGDLAMGIIPFSWMWNNYSANIVEGKAATYGTARATQYMFEIGLRLGPVAVPVLAAALLAGRRYRPLLLAALGHVLVHSLIDHKEPRFIWPAMLPVLVVGAIGTVEVLRRHLAGNAPLSRLAPQAWLAMTGVCIALIAVLIGHAHPHVSMRNFWIVLSAATVLGCLLLDRFLPQPAPGAPRRGRWALAFPVLLAIWLGASQIAMTLVRITQPIRISNEQGALITAAGADPRICGVAVDDNWLAIDSYVFLQRPIPILYRDKWHFEPPDQVDPQVMAGANALVLSERISTPPGYRRGACRGEDADLRLCLFTRPGGCQGGQASQRFMDGRSLMPLGPIRGGLR